MLSASLLIGWGVPDANPFIPTIPALVCVQFTKYFLIPHRLGGMIMWAGNRALTSTGLWVMVCWVDGRPLFALTCFTRVQGGFWVVWLSLPQETGALYLCSGCTSICADGWGCINQYPRQTTCCLRSFGILMALIYQIMKIPTYRWINWSIFFPTQKHFPPRLLTSLRSWPLCFKQIANHLPWLLWHMLKYGGCTSMLSSSAHKSSIKCLSELPATHLGHLTRSPTIISMDFNETLTDCPCLPC